VKVRLGVGHKNTCCVALKNCWGRLSEALVGEGGGAKGVLGEIQRPTPFCINTLDVCWSKQPKNVRIRYFSGVEDLAEGHRNDFHPATTFSAERLALGGAILGGEEGGEDGSSRANYRYVGGMCE